MFNPGPGDASVPSSRAGDDAGHGDGGEPTILITDFGLQNLSPVELWNKALEKYCVLERCEQLYKEAERRGESATRESVDQQRAIALAEAVLALRSLGNKEARRRLVDFERFRTEDVVFLQYGHEPAFLSHFEPQFWACAFTDLFPYGDCQEKYPHLHQNLPCRKLANALTSRADFARWRDSLEYCGVVYNVSIARAHMWAIYTFTMQSQWFRLSLIHI